MFEKIKMFMTLGDKIKGYKTHAMTLSAVLTSATALLTMVIIPFMSGDISMMVLVTEGWPYLIAIIGAFGMSAMKAGMDRK